MAPRLTKVTGQSIDNCARLAVTQDASTADTAFREVIWRCGQFRRSAWTDCRFHTTTFDRRSLFEECSFVRCRFEGGHTHLCGEFRRCRFVDCSFDSATFWGARLSECQFTSAFENMIFFGSEAERGGPTPTATVLDRCDFTGSTFLDTDFRLGIDVSSCKFPNGYDPHWLYPLSPK
jgi:uncharacterized protein YjbI with pentapeptide repeats